MLCRAAPWAEAVARLCKQINNADLRNAEPGAAAANDARCIQACP